MLGSIILAAVTGVVAYKSGFKNGFFSSTKKNKDDPTAKDKEYLDIEITETTKR